MHILRTRPSGETSAERALNRRGVETLRPVEIHVTRKRTRRGGSENIRSERQLLPCYLLATSSDCKLANAIADMALREPRKDVQDILGMASSAELAPVLERHNRIIDGSSPSVQVGDTAIVGDGPLREFRVKVLAIRGAKARVNVGPYLADVPIATLTTYSQTHVPQR